MAEKKERRYDLDTVNQTPKVGEAHKQNTNQQ